MSRTHTVEVQTVLVDDGAGLRVNVVLYELVDLVLVGRECVVRRPLEVAPAVVIAQSQLDTVIAYATGLDVHGAITRRY